MKSNTRRMWSQWITISAMLVMFVVMSGALSYVRAQPPTDIFDDLTCALAGGTLEYGFGGPNSGVCTFRDVELVGIRLTFSMPAILDNVTFVCTDGGAPPNLVFVDYLSVGGGPASEFSVGCGTL